jgi:transposase
MVPSKRQDGCEVVFQARFPSIAPSACWSFRQIVTIRNKKKLTGENVIFRCGRGTAAINAFLAYRRFAHGYLHHTDDTQQKAHLPRWEEAPSSPDRDQTAFGGNERHVAVKRAYMANRDARAALTQTECGACTDWTI